MNILYYSHILNTFSYFSALKMYLMSIHGHEKIDAVFWEMQMIILRSLLAVQQVMISDKHCFELYGE